MNVLPTRLVAFALLGLISACASNSPFRMNPDSYLEPGSTITLNEPVVVPRNSVAAPIRGGHIGDRYTFEGQCRLEILTLTSEPLVIEPDTFEVERTNWEWEYFGGLHPKAMYAAIITPEGPSLFWYTTYFFLKSDLQPDVYRLRCRHLQESDINPRYLTLNQMQQVLGDIMTSDSKDRTAN